MSARQQTLATIRKAFRAYPNKMLTITDIANNTQLSYNTVKNALPLTGARYVPGAWPQRWTMQEVEGTILPIKPIVQQADTPTDLQRVGGTSVNATDVVIAVKPETAANWNAAKESFIAELDTFDIQRSSDIEELTAKFSMAARSLASVALGLMEVSTSPDWYDKLFSEDVDTDLAP